jgi:hypothetical protein
LLEATISFIGFSMTQYLFSGEIEEERQLKTRDALVAGTANLCDSLSHPPGVDWGDGGHRPAGFAN